jgi:hypothetical protein
MSHVSHTSHTYETSISMSITETLDDLAKLELSRFEELTPNSLENPTATTTAYPIVTQLKVAPKVVLMAGQSKIALSTPDRLLFRLNKYVTKNRQADGTRRR